MVGSRCNDRSDCGLYPAHGSDEDVDVSLENMPADSLEAFLRCMVEPVVPGLGGATDTNEYVEMARTGFGPCSGSLSSEGDPLLACMSLAERGGADGLTKYDCEAAHCNTHEHPHDSFALANNTTHRSTHLVGQAAVPAGPSTRAR